MVKYHRDTVGSFLTAPERTGGCGGAWHRLLPVLSAAALRRRLFGAVVCGGGSAHKGFGCSRRFLLGSARPAASPTVITTTVERESRSVQKGQKSKLLELIQAEPPEEECDEEEECDDDETEEEEEDESGDKRKKKAEVMMERMQDIVTRLRSQTGRDAAARDVRRLAKGDPKAREVIAGLGAISPLVTMIDDAGAYHDTRVDALYALLNLGIGNDRNKAAIVEAGALHSMLRVTEQSTDTATSSITAAVVANLLSLSALDANKPIVGTSGAIPFLVSTYRTPLTDDNHSAHQTRDDALRALFNLSLYSTNAPLLAQADIITSLLAALEDADDANTATSERALSTLSNIIAGAPEGRRELSRRASDAFPLLVDALGWDAAPRCQEAAAYILMVMAHRSSQRDRAAMAEAGANSALLELTLLGTPLAQKRAAKILDFLATGKAIRVASDRYAEEGVDGAASCSMSAPQSGPVKQGPPNDEVLSEERKAVRRLVMQSLESNMRRITRRANVPDNPLHFPPPDRIRGAAAGMAAAASPNSSKSLPF